MIISESEIEQAVIEYLERRGVIGIERSKLSMSSWEGADGHEHYQCEIKLVELPVREGPFR